MDALLMWMTVHYIQAVTLLGLGQARYRETEKQGTGHQQTQRVEVRKPKLLTGNFGNITLFWGVPVSSTSLSTPPVSPSLLLLGLLFDILRVSCSIIGSVFYRKTGQSLPID